MISLIVDNKVRITGLDHAHTHVMTQGLKIRNAQYFTMKRLGKSVYGVPEWIRYYKIDGDTLIVPLGLLGRVRSFLKRNDLIFQTVADRRVKKKRSGAYLQTVELYDYQNDCVEKSLRGGTVVMGTGCGKTVTMLATIFKLGLTATILVPRTNIAQQWIQECKDKFGYDPGVVTGKKKEVKGITIATFQSLAVQKKRLADLARDTSILVVDECHGSVTAKRRQVISAFRPSVLLGCTASPERTDGQEEAIYHYFGEKCFEYHKTALSPVVDVIRTEVKIPVKREYYQMVDAMVANDARNTLIAGTVLGEVMSGRKVLVLTKRIEHYEKIREKLPEMPGLHFIDSSDPVKDEKLMMFRGGLLEYSAIFGTTSLLSEGLDIPSLDTLVIACDMRSSVLTTQSVGRVLRAMADKPSPRVVDLWDKGNAILNSQAQTRFRLYKKKGWSVLF